MHEGKQIESNNTDFAVSIGKGLLGAAPFVGPMLSEIVGNVIPNQRIDRLSLFATSLYARLKDVEEAFLKARISQPEAVDLIEDGFIQAARATSRDRIDHIASIVANGLSAEELKHTESKRMLWLLGQLEDSEIIVLRSRIALTQGDVERDIEFRSKHSELLAPDMTHMGSTPEEFEAAALKESYRQHLHELGLLRQRFKKAKKGEFPDFDDKTGMMKASGSDVTRLGKMLLKNLNLIPDWYQH